MVIESITASSATMKIPMNGSNTVSRRPQSRVYASCALVMVAVTLVIAVLSDRISPLSNQDDKSPSAAFTVSRRSRLLAGENAIDTQQDEQESPNENVNVLKPSATGVCMF